MLELAEAYMDLDSSVSLSISGGGSGVGIASLLNGRADVANSSRAVNEYEIALARERGLDLQGTVFASDALAIVCHPAVALDSLTLEQLGDIYSGKIKNWSVMGGPDAPISLYGRQSNSGTFLYLRDEVLKKDFSSDLKQLNGTAQIIEAVKQDANGIGYVGIGYLSSVPVEDLRILALKARGNARAISPLDSIALKDGKYPLTRPLYQYTNGKPSGKIAAFFAFERSPAGLAIVRKNGYLPPSVSLNTQNQ